MRSFKRILKNTLIILFVLLLAFAAGLYYIVCGSNVNATLDDEYIHIPSQSIFPDLVAVLDKGDYLQSMYTFRIVAMLMEYDNQTVRSGRFKLEPGWSNRRLIQHLRSGNQAPVTVTINNVRRLEQLGGKFASNLELDSASFSWAILDPEFIREYGYTRENFLTMFLPNSYEMYWNTSVRECVDRMKREHDVFWSKNSRAEKLKETGLSKEQLYTLASIVEKETNFSSEKSRIAGVYLNRLEQGIRLQADPTVVYAVGDLSLRRVLNKHLEYDSPYNTYLYEGLPPGPICMPSLETIDAALMAEDHNYIFFCAKPGYGSEHAFASTLEQHNQNARRYRDWLRSENIR